MKHKLIYFFITIIVFQFNIYNALQWQRSNVNSSLLSNKEGCFIGTNNNGSIFLLGGKSSSTALIGYNTLTQTYTDHSYTVSFGYQQSQSSVQINNTLYMLPRGSSVITAFNLNTLNVENTFSNFPGFATVGRCMTHFGSSIIVIGGLGGSPTQHSNNTYILDIETDTWSIGPYLPIFREFHACNTIKSTIYVIGGWGSNYNKVYKLDVDSQNNCCDGTWSEMSSTLSRKQELRSIEFETKLYLLGGYDGGNKIQVVTVIDTQSDNIIQDSNMLYKKNRVASIITNNVLYVFGGFPTGSTNEAYQYAIIPTNSPTNSPSNIPTTNPSNPTANPSSHPSLNPTFNPTSIPSRYPTMNPSRYPSINPSIYPSLNPSIYPSLNPTKIPSNDPTLNPINDAKANPTSYPSWTPTIKDKEGSVSDTTLNIQNNNDDKKSTGDEKGSNSVIWLIVSVIVVTCILLCGVLWFYNYRSKKKNNLKTNKNNVQITKVGNAKNNDEDIVNAINKTDPGIAFNKVKTCSISFNETLANTNMNINMSTDDNNDDILHAINKTHDGRSVDKHLAEPMDINATVGKNEDIGDEFVVNGDSEDENIIGSTKTATPYVDNNVTPIAPNIEKYKEWKIKEMLEWIRSLESGRFNKYLNTLQQGFISDGIDGGDCLPDLSVGMLRDKPFNITNFRDRRDLANHFKSLKSQQISDNIDNLNDEGEMTKYHTH